MTVAIPNNVVLQSFVGIDTEFVRISENGTQTERIAPVSTECVTNISLCIAQNADKTFVLQDATDVSYENASEITFTVWESATGTGAAVLTKTLTGGDITLGNPYSFTFDVSNTESGALTPSNKYCEAWVTLASTERRLVGAGSFRVIDTRKFD